jgi:hypothetical protein
MVAPALLQKTALLPAGLFRFIQQPVSFCYLCGFLSQMYLIYSLGLMQHP